LKRKLAGRRGKQDRSSSNNNNNKNEEQKWRCCCINGGSVAVKLFSQPLSNPALNIWIVGGG